MLKMLVDFYGRGFAFLSLRHIL